MKKLLSLIICIMIAMTTVFAFGCNGDAGLYDDKKDTTYTITADEVQHATMEISASSVIHGHGVNIKVYPESANYVLYELRINNGAISSSSILKETYQGRTYFEYSVSSVTSDLHIVAKMSTYNVTVHFAGVAEAIDDMQAVSGLYYGELPTPIETNKRFVGWYDSGNNRVHKESKVYALNEITLTAKFEMLTDSEKQKLTPTAMTSSYYDSAATSYGVVWHNYTVPSAPAVLVADNADFTNAKVFAAETERLYGNREYVNAAVVNGLEYDTTYYAKIGDLSIADADRNTYWSKTFTFKTRKETVDSAKFFYMNSTLQTYLTKYLDKEENGVGNAGGAITDTYWSYVLKQASSQFGDVDFLAHGGNFVSHNFEADMWNETLSSVEDYLFNLPIMPTGNKYEADRFYPTPIIRNMLSKMFNISTPNNGISEVGRYYSFDYGPMHFITLRTNDLYRTSDVQMTIGETKMQFKQLNWLKEDLEATKKNSAIKWTVVMMAESPVDIDGESLTQITTKVKTDLQEYLTEKISVLCTTYGVDLVLTTSPRTYSLFSTKPLICNSATKQYSVANITPTTVSTPYGNVEQYAYTAQNFGTIYYQTGSAGAIYGDKYSSDSTETGDFGRKVLSGKKGQIEGITGSLSMYSYVTITNGELTVLTYGVDVAAVAKTLAANADADISAASTLLDAIRITK